MQGGNKIEGCRDTSRSSPKINEKMSGEAEDGLEGVLGDGVESTVK